MTKTLREALDQIDELLVDSVIGLELWCVLTAMRGPDNQQDWKLKTEFTAPLRTMAFPRFGAVAYTDSSTHRMYNQHDLQVGGTLEEPKIENLYEGDHFLHHMRTASWALHRSQREGEQKAKDEVLFT